MAASVREIRRLLRLLVRFVVGVPVPRSVASVLSDSTDSPVEAELESNDCRKRLRSSSSNREGVRESNRSICSSSS
uniref:Putative secreted protein n=1 Tax=Anopheles darlingi TaxID=43151 RepID=A0A2M4DN09_ANODA